MADCWCDNGFAYSFYFRNMPPPQKYLRLKLSALHSRVLGLFDTLPHCHYKCWVDNLCTSVNFLIHSLKHKAHVMVEGVCRSGGRGFPDVAKQEEVRGEANLRSVVGTVKAAELIVDGLEDKIVATSVYDSKPAYFLSSSCESITWVKKTKKVWVHENDSIMNLEFLRLSSANNYNNGMGDVDIADQKRGSYRPDRFMRKMKWWWSMWIWGLGVLLVNCYISYVTFLQDNNVPKKNILSQYDFRKAIALAWLDPKNYWKSNEKKRSADEINESSAVATRSRKKLKKKSTYITDDSFRPNGNMSDRLSRGIEHDFEMCSKHSRCAIHRWATDRKVSRHNDVYFCPVCNICVCISCHKLLRNEKDILSLKNELCTKFLQERKDKNIGRSPVSPSSDARAEKSRINRETIAQSV